VKTRILFKIILVLLAWPGLARASSANALKRYEAGKYESALREYKRLLLENPDDPRLHFNAGTAAFQANDFEQAQKQLNAALVTQDLQLQERTYYNLGNTGYRLGTEATAPDRKQANWEEAIGHYESALKLNPKDEDAKFNLDLVKKQLEELRKQQQQQKQQSKDDQKDQSKKNDQSKDKDQQQQDKQDQKQQQKDEQQKQQDKADQQKQQPEQNKEDQKPEDQQSAKKQDAEEQKKHQAQQGKDSKDKENPEEQRAQASKAVIARMTPEQAQQLLDAQRADEKTMIFIPKLKTNRVDRVFKDW
jgi:Ca-activated chloride channel family protein